MGDIFRSENIVDSLYKTAPEAIYLGWYWHKKDTSCLKNFIHIYEDYKKIQFPLLN